MNFYSTSIIKGILKLQKLLYSLLNVTHSAKTCIVHRSMYIRTFIEKSKIKNYLWNYACYWKIFTRIDGASNQQRKLQINKNYIPSYSPGYGKFKNLCFVSVAWMVSVSCAFVYNAVDINKIATTFFGKTATIDTCKCTVSLRVISIAYLFGQSLVNILS